MQTVVQENTTQSKSNTKPFVAPVSVIQKKLSIGASDDVYEAEADLVADQVMRMSESKVHTYAQTGPLVQRKCSGCEEEERLQKKAISGNTSPAIQKLAAGNKNNNIASDAVNTKINNSRGGGSIMGNGTRSFMENRFGRDFSSVHIHTDSNAVQLSKSLNAQAFTVGNDIYFNEGKYNPNSNSGKHLLAHELTHTVQQGGKESGTIKKKQNLIIQRNIFGDALRGVGSAAEWGWDHTGGAAIRFGGRVITWVADKAEEIIEDIAPGLLSFLRNGWNSLRDSLASALDTMTGGLFSQLQAEGLSGILNDFVSNIINSLSGKVVNACKSFAALAKKIFNFIEKLTGRALERVRVIFTKISDGLSFLWNEVGKPAIDAVKSVASDVWNWIVEKATWVWDLIEPIRNAISRAWNWIMDKFDLAWDSANSALDWLSEKLSEAWDWIVSIIEPIKAPLMIIGSILLLLSPLGPFVAIGAAAYGIYRAVTWVKDNWDSEVFVRFRGFLKEHILDPIASGIEQLKNMAASAFEWLNNAFTQLKVQVSRLMEALGAFGLFRLLKGALQRFGQMINQAASWIQRGIGSILTFIGGVLSDIWEVIRPFAIIVIKLAFLATNPWLLPPVLIAWFWRALPDCFKPAIINFVIRIMILVLSSMPDFKNFGETWFQVKSQMIQFLTEILSGSDEEKITASNRVAKMVSELDLELISNQVEAAIQMPGEIEGQMEEEMLGMDLTKPLAFELTQAPVLASQFQSLGLTNQVSPEDARLFSQQHYSENDIAVDAVGEFVPSDALLADMQSRISGEEGTFEFGNTEDEDSRSVHAILSEIVQQTGGSSLTDAGETGLSESGIDASEEPAEPMTQEEETEFRLQQMIAQSGENMAGQACNPPQQAPQNDATEGFPEHAKFGPLSRSQRASYMMGQMWSGIRKWWRCNRHWLIPSLIGAIVVLVVAELLSGGWVTAAIPIIFEALIPIMIGVAAVRSAYYVGQYVYKSVRGDIAGAAKALARSLAVVATELIFALLGSSAFWRNVSHGATASMNLARGTGRAMIRGVQRTVRAGSRMAGRIGGTARRVVLSSGRAVVRRGRLVMRGVGRRVGRGARSLEELAERLYARVRFKRFRIRFSSRRFFLEGYINPWVTLANGSVEFFEQNQLRPARSGSTLDETVRLGDEVFIGGTTRRGVVGGVRRTPSQFITDLASRSGRRITDEFRRLRGAVGSRLSRAQRLRIIQNGQNTIELRRGIAGAQPAFFQAHHIIPRQLSSQFDDFFRRIGFNIEDGLRNGIMIPPDSVILRAAIASDPSLASRFGNSALHLGSHPQYTDLIRTELQIISDLLNQGLIRRATAVTYVNTVISRARTAIGNGNGIHINQVTF